MSKPIIGLFAGTIGDKRGKELVNKTTRNNATQNHRHVVLWAQKTADELENQSKRQRNKFNTASVAYDEITGQYYYGRNGGIELNQAKKNRVLFGDNTHSGILPKTSFNNFSVGNCAEVDAINNALNAGAKLHNLHISTIHTTRESFGDSKAACENCTYAFKGRVRRNYTGWHQEERK